MVWKIYHNPACSKSRDSLALLRLKGIEPTIVHYLSTPPDAQTLYQLLAQLGGTAEQLLRDGEPEFVVLGRQASLLSQTEIITLIGQYPQLLQRPIISNGSRAVFGRPAENLLSLM